MRKLIPMPRMRDARSGADTSAVSLAPDSATHSTTAGADLDVANAPCTDGRFCNAVKYGAGGNLKGSYSGTAGGFPCDLMAKKGGTWKFSGKGRMSFLRSSTESGQMAAPYRPGTCTLWRGSATFVSTSNPANTITVALTGGDGSSFPCGFHFRFAVTGGTGRFKLATGQGKVTFFCNPNNGNMYTDRWTGTLNF